MPKSPKRPTDVNQLAKRIVDLATGEAHDPSSEPPDTVKRAAKGGDARARKLTKAERQAIAKKGAAARWKKE